MNLMKPPYPLPDVASQPTHNQYQALHWVGMTRLPVNFELLDTELGNHRCQGYAEIGVDLIDPKARGIHMSRLYLGLEQFCRKQLLSPQNLQKLLTELLETHSGLSQAASLGLDFEMLLDRPALKSELRGLKAYPVRIYAWRDDEATGLALELTVPYSSTCPCSTSLAKAHIKKSLDSHFNGGEIDKDELYAWIDEAGEDFPTPHSQRSFARVRLQINEAAAQQFNVLYWLNAIENSLQTAVQTAVKREDELAFAQRNGANLMFCEDAARRLQELLNADASLADYWLEVDHQESLHAHNAVARTSKNKGFSGLYNWNWSQGNGEG